MPRYFYVITCHECDRKITTEEITPQAYAAYVSKGFTTDVETLPGHSTRSSVVYEAVQDICGACVDATLVGDDD